MVRYALMGATGATGTAILRHLLQEPANDQNVNVYVRSKAKLLDKFPDLETQAPFPTKIYEGSNTDRTVLKQCLHDVDVICMCIATNVSTPGESRFTDTANAVTDALLDLKKEQASSYKTPSILILRASILNPTFSPARKGYFESFLMYCLHHLYNNMNAANEIYEAKARETPGLLNIIYVDPPGIHDNDGTNPTGYELLLAPPADRTPVFNLSYADLGIAFCEIARRREEFNGKGVGVFGTGEIKLTWPILMGHLSQGLRGRVLGW
ncbi:hypothetical protein DOTSEDRAFT_153162 [Dothistroma septosporum NZE10]|uniref:NAD(P)-binding domain-containing protein n=1 Tax=Dothistroma septosporum (strain NZE10 / CBS 128990) TaxID=675120 RepID=M2YM26_DOTSN|nr:hypothetical protein DOTSEDRAFT_153162 [Dothistroma septosporum NZE10]